jgi:hypothetical protein
MITTIGNNWEERRAVAGGALTKNCMKLQIGGGRK